jgi:hypothetical protein
LAGFALWAAAAGENAGFTGIALLTVAIGIASIVPIFGFVDYALLRPLPYPNSSRLVALGETSLRGSAKLDGCSCLNYFDVARSNRSFASSAAGELHAVKAPPPLVQPAKRWRYTQTLLNGEPVEVETTITVTFKLGG